MEAAAGAGRGQCLQCNFYSPTKPSLVAAATAYASSSSIPFKTSSSSFFKCLKTKGRNHLQQQSSSGFPRHVVQASSAAETTSTTSTTAVQERWILVPVGDGDSRHIGFQVKMPGAFEIASNEVTVGRVPEKADMVIPVATVSGVHARIQKRGGNLLVTDLDSTNGTFIGEKRLRPGVASTLASGNVVIFGDIHLAMFRASKLENVEVASNGSPTEEETEAEAETEKSSEATSS